MMAQFMQIKADQTALLVIDVQQALFTRQTPIYNAYKVIETINALVSRAHLFGVEVIFIQHANDSFLQEGTDGWRFHPDLKTSPTDITIQKEHGNAFVGTSLQSRLEARRIENLIITGLVTQGCVRATSLGGLEAGYRVFLVQGGHSNYNKDAPKVIEEREKELAEAGVVVAAPGQIDFR